MSEIRKSESLQKAWDRLVEENVDNEAVLDALEEVPDGCCTTGFDNDGSTGYEIFENGFDLAFKAAGRPVWQIDNEEQAFFFIGTAEEAETKPPGGSDRGEGASRGITRFPSSGGAQVVAPSAYGSAEVATMKGSNPSLALAHAYAQADNERRLDKMIGDLVEKARIRRLVQDANAPQPKPSVLN
jgi:hypothetical protein